VCVMKKSKPRKGLRKIQKGNYKESTKANVELGYSEPAPDRSALEIHYSRSMKIRTKVHLFAAENMEHAFPSFAAMVREFANAANCSTETARRWIRQYCDTDVRNASFRLVRDDTMIIQQSNRNKKN